MKTNSAPMTATARSRQTNDYVIYVIEYFEGPAASLYDDPEAESLIDISEMDLCVDEFSCEDCIDEFSGSADRIGSAFRWRQVGRRR